jgi:hypothetical protein
MNTLYLKRNLITLALLAFSLSSYAYQLKGKVTDVSGEAIPGVNVTIEGTSKGAQTDMDGQYTLEVEGTETLTFSFISFENQVIKLNGQKILDVTLLESASSLDEIVVVGSRSGGRPRMETPVPVDVIDMKNLVES